ncbi:MAG: TRAP transporter large permease subunit [Betaproteobacteria bacterium]|nr:MAG: TRAP transporter large permease subunit [Betaproteobacteria bacterium]
MAAARLGTGRLSPLDARKHRLGPARDHDAGRQMSFLLPALMLAGLAVALFSGLPVAVVLIGVAFLFAGLGILAGSVRIEEMGAIFHRVYGTLSDRDEVLYAAVPMLLFMGAVLHESRLAADLLAGAARLFGRVRGGPALATLAVAAIQAPAAGMVGASTGALALYALPQGLVAAAGTLGVVAPPGIMLFFVADAIGAQVPALFLAMLGPLALLLVLYFAYAVVRGSPKPVRENAEAVRAVDALVPALLMIGLVVIVALGYATISEAAGLAALGAVLAALARGRMSWSALDAAIRRTALVSAMIFFIFVGASVFSLVFRLLGGQAMISAAAAALGSRGALSLAAAMIFVFVLGFFLDWLEIVVIALPALASALVAAGVGAQFGNAQLAACWLGALFAVNLQTSFLTPPFGYALFLVHGATGGAVTIPQVWRGALPYLVLQLVTLIALAVLPELATWLPAQMLDLSVPKGPKFNE